MSQRPAKKPGTSRETKDQTKDDQGPAKKPGANRETRSHQEPPETSRSQQEVPKTTRNHQRPSETTRDHQSHQSHQGARATREPERATRGTSIGNRKKTRLDRGLSSHTSKPNPLCSCPYFVTTAPHATTPHSTVVAPLP